MDEQSKVKNPDDQGKESGREVVTIFVRKGKEDENTRLISFNSPVQCADDVMSEVLNAGLTIDGRSYCYLVTPYTQVGHFFKNENEPAMRFLYEGVEARGLMLVLNEVEIMLRNWLEEKGLLVYFA